MIRKSTKSKIFINRNNKIFCSINIINFVCQKQQIHRILLNFKPRYYDHHWIFTCLNSEVVLIVRWSWVFALCIACTYLLSIILSGCLQLQLSKLVFLTPCLSDCLSLSCNVSASLSCCLKQCLYICLGVCQVVLPSLSVSLLTMFVCLSS